MNRKGGTQQTGCGRCKIKSSKVVPLLVFDNVLDRTVKVSHAGGMEEEITLTEEVKALRARMANTQRGGGFREWWQEKLV